jgi:hypothetical protein
MDFNAVAKRITNKETLPWCRSSIFGFDSGRLQFRPQSIHIGVLQAEVPIRIRAESPFFHRNMDVPSADIEPDAATTANRHWFGNLMQSQASGIKGPGEIFAAFRHGDIDVGKLHAG